MHSTFTILACLTQDEPAIRRITAINPHGEVRPAPWLTDSEPLPSELLRGVDALFCEMPPENFHDFDRLKWIHITSAGYSQVLDLPVLERGIRVSNGRGVFDIPIAEWNIGMIVNLARDVRGLIANQERGIWDRDKRFQHEIRGSVVGLWGYGGIARETVRLAKAMGMQTHVLVRDGVKSRENIYCVPGTGDPHGELPDRVFNIEQKAEFLAGLDFLILTTPLTPQTEGMVGEVELQSLPRHAMLLNPARGPLIQEQALLRALSEGWIAGAALDTHYHYPMPPDHPLWSMPNVIMTPHISGAAESQCFLPRAWDIFAANVERFIGGRPLLNELTRAQLEGK